MQSALIQDFAELNALPDSFVQDAQRWLIPLADSLRARIMLTNSESGAHDALLIGVSGCQGSGKSTASELLANLLQAEGMRTATLRARGPRRDANDELQQLVGIPPHAIGGTSPG